MPSKTPTACTRPQCGGLVRDGVCSRCGPLRRRADKVTDAKRGNFRQRGYSTQWDAVRKLHLKGEPLCRMCATAGRVTAAVMVDHIVPIADGGAVLDDTNLQSLCTSCHASKTREDLRRRKAGTHGGGGSFSRE